MLRRHLEPELRPDASPAEIMKQVVLTLETRQNTQQFTKEELVAGGREYGLSEGAAEDAVMDLLEEEWLQEVEGSHGDLLERFVWRRYSPAFEEETEGG